MFWHFSSKNQICLFTFGGIFFCSFAKRKRNAEAHETPPAERTDQNTRPHALYPHSTYPSLWTTLQVTLCYTANNETQICICLAYSSIRWWLSIRRNLKSKIVPTDHIEIMMKSLLRKKKMAAARALQKKHFLSFILKLFVYFCFIFILLFLQCLNLPNLIYLWWCIFIHLYFYFFTMFFFSSFCCYSLPCLYDFYFFFFVNGHLLLLLTCGSGDDLPVWPSTCELVQNLHADQLISACYLALYNSIFCFLK